MSFEDIAYDDEIRTSAKRKKDKELLSYEECVAVLLTTDGWGIKRKSAALQRLLDLHDNSAAKS